MSYCTGLLLGVFLYIRNHSKILYGLAFLYACIIFGFNYQNPDYFNYQRTYYGTLNSDAFVSISASEPGFRFLYMIGQYLGLSYQSMCLIFALLGLSLISVTILEYSPYPNIVFLMYLLYPFAIDVVQIRQFLAASVFIYSLRFFCKYKITSDKRNMIYYILGNVVAVSLHYSAILFSGFLLILFFPKKHAALYCGICGLILFFVVIGLPRLVPSLQALVPLITVKLRRWIGQINFSSILHMFRILAARGGLILLCMLARYSKHNLKLRHEKATTHDRGWQITNQVLLYAMLYFLFTSSLLEGLLDSQFERISRPGLIIGYILVTRYASGLKLSNRMIVFACCLLFGGLYFMNIMFVQRINDNLNWFSFVFREVFEHNLLFEQIDVLLSM